MNKLKVGDMAPDFSAADQSGKIVTLGQFRGQRLILYFYPKDNTSGCTFEARSLRDGRSELADMGFEIVGVSPDSTSSHQCFIEKNQLNFTLLSDPDKRMMQDYGAWGLKKYMGREYMGVLRTTFVIDAEGRIEKIFDKVDTKNHWTQIADSYKASL